MYETENVLPKEARVEVIGLLNQRRPTRAGGLSPRCSKNHPKRPNSGSPSSGAAYGTQSVWDMRSFIDRPTSQNVHRNYEFLTLASNQNTPNGRHVAVIAAPPVSNMPQ